MSERQAVQSPDPINFENLLKNVCQMPLVKIDRENFLRSTLSHQYDQKTVDLAVSRCPAYAGITVEEINKLAKASINRETTTVTSLSFASGLPGGFGMAAALPADTAQYFAHILRIMQKLVYLYGWQSLLDEDNNIDDETMNLLTLFTGLMFGVNEANHIIAKIADSTAKNIAKKLARKALTKGTVYPVVKKVASILGVRMTKNIFAKGVSTAVPVIGGFVSGGITLATYMPMAEKFRQHLSEMQFADVEFFAKQKETTDADTSMDDVYVADVDSENDFIS